MLRVAVWILLVGPVSLHAQELRLSAKKLHEVGACFGMHLSADGTALELERGVLSEGDGPAAGYSYKPNEEKLSATTWIKKELHVRAGAKKATLLVAPGGKLDAIINGKPCTLSAPEKIGSYWQGYDIAPELLVDGKNEIILYGAGKMWIARDEDFPFGSTTVMKHPNQSAKSSDGGKTWSYDKLGAKDDMDGEYYVRLALDQYDTQSQSFGRILLDTANLDGVFPPPVLAELGAIRVRTVADTGSTGEVQVSCGTGVAPAGIARTYKGSDVRIDKPQGRYLEIHYALRTSDPQRTPRLKEIVVSASHRLAADDWMKRVVVKRFENDPLPPLGLSFVGENHAHPKLKELRERYKLDEVVKGATNDVELMGKLAGWASKQFSKMHLRDAYPAWDALDILKPHADGTPVGGFCQQYNVVLLQACQSFGLVGRAVSIGPGDHGDKIRSGHEVVEIWSNDLRKWVYMDGQKAWHMVDDASGVPLSLLDLHQRQMAVLGGKSAPGVRVVKWSDAAPEWGGLESFPPFVELRLIPRSNFLSEKAPLPLNQGMRGWFWTGHHVWAADIPQRSSLLYSRFVRHPRHWNAPVNHVHLTLEPLAAAGELRVHLRTSQDMRFESFDVRFDGGEPRSSKASAVSWKLHAGENRLDVTPHTGLGREGVRSWIILELR